MCVCTCAYAEIRGQLQSCFSSPVFEFQGLNYCLQAFEQVPLPAEPFADL